MKPEDQAAFEQAKNKTLTDERKLEIIKNSELWDMHIHMGWYSVPSKSFVEKSFKLIDDIQAALAHRDAQTAGAQWEPVGEVVNGVLVRSSIPEGYTGLLYTKSTSNVVGNEPLLYQLQFLDELDRATIAAAEAEKAKGGV